MHRDVGFLRQQVDLVVDEDHSVQECLQLSMTGGQWAQSEWILRLFHADEMATGNVQLPEVYD